MSGMFCRSVRKDKMGKLAADPIAALYHLEPTSADGKEGKWLLVSHTDRIK